jgi:hypothetical protein
MHYARAGWLGMHFPGGFKQGSWMGWAWRPADVNGFACAAEDGGRRRCKVGPGLTYASAENWTCHMVHDLT